MNTITVRDLCLGDGIPKICIPIVAHTAAELDTALEALDPGLCDLAEFRADFYFEDEMQALAKIRKKMGSKPVIYTIRTMEEGGDIEIGQEEYEARNLAASEYADLADIQYRRLRAKERDADVHSRIVPMLLGCRPRAVRRRALFPLPLGPTTASTSPGRKVRETPRRAYCPA